MIFPLKYIPRYGMVSSMLLLQMTLPISNVLSPSSKAYATMIEGMRFATLLHLNVGPGFEGFSDDYIPSVRAPIARSPRQEEARRNTFWMCYVTERLYARLPAHAMCVDDCDVSQALPLRGDLFEEGVGSGVQLLLIQMLSFNFLG